MKSPSLRLENGRVSSPVSTAFAVLVAGLSARQSGSATARHQMMLKRTMPGGIGGHETGLLDEYLDGSPAEKGSFNADVARAMTAETRR